MQRISIPLTDLEIVFAVAVLAGFTLLGNQGATNYDRSPASNKESLSATDTIVLQGTVVYKDLEGGFFTIEGVDGSIYNPINLPEAYQREGLKVKVNAIFRKDIGSIHMVGDVIEIVDIAAG